MARGLPCEAAKNLSGPREAGGSFPACRRSVPTCHYVPSAKTWLPLVARAGLPTRRGKAGIVSTWACVPSAGSRFSTPAQRAGLPPRRGKAGSGGLLTSVLEQSVAEHSDPPRSRQLSPNVMREKKCPTTARCRLQCQRLITSVIHEATAMCEIFFSDDAGWSPDQGHLIFLLAFPSDANTQRTNTHNWPPARRKKLRHVLLIVILIICS